jgi:serine/threonine-protein kinase
VRFVALDGDHATQTFIQGPFNAGGARFSPDGNWVAYVSDESGRNEVYVRPYPEGTRVQISAAGGTQPVWSSNGRELFFRNGDQLLAVNVTLGRSFAASKPVVLFSRSIAADSSGIAYELMADYDVSKDGQRFVFPKSSPESAEVPHARVILDWFSELKRLTTAAK